MKNQFTFIILFLSFTCFSQLEKINVSIGFQYSTAKYFEDNLTNSVNNVNLYYYNFPFDSFDNKFGHRIETRYISIPTLKIGCNAPILTFNRFSLGIDGALEFGLGFEYKNPTYEYKGFTPLFEEDFNRNTLDLTFGGNLNLFARYYLLNKFEKKAYITPFIGFRSLKTLESFTMPDFGIGFGQKNYELKFHCHFTKVQYHRELIKVKKEVYKEFLLPFSVSFCLHLGSDDF